jgi:hypothetical protein
MTTKQLTFRLGRLVGLAGLVALLLATISLADASAAVKPDGCPTDKPLVVDSYVTGENDADYGADGHVWALDAGTRFIRIWRLGGDAYCVQLHDVGTFTSFAGLSPEGTGTVSAGVTGSYDGTSYLRIYGTFAPTVATTGFVGNFDVQCQQDGTCAGSGPRLRRLYFSSIYNFDGGAFAYTYDGGACGTWFQSSSGDTGDIVC